MQKKEAEQRILALDYDGVIADSQFECLAVGFNAYLKLNKTKLFGGSRFTFDNFKMLIRNNKGIVDKYKKLRPYVIDAFCYYVIMHIIDGNIRIKNQNHYNKIRNKLMKFYDGYVRHFYNERYSFQKEDFNKFLKFMKPYKIVKSIKRLKNDYILTIASNNKRKGIAGSLKKYRIPVETIADSDIGINKTKQIGYIKDKYKAKYSDIYFVDDQVSHFPKLMKLGVKCFLATWGYNNAEQRAYAKKLGAVLLSERNFDKFLGLYSQTKMII